MKFNDLSRRANFFLFYMPCLTCHVKQIPYYTVERDILRSYITAVDIIIKFDKANKRTAIFMD